MAQDGQAISRGPRADKVIIDDITSTKYIYIAGPLNVDSDDEKVNVQVALMTAEAIINMGAMPYVPHLTLFWDKQFKHPKEYWMKLDTFWLAKCDALYRIPGNSEGAEEEVLLAHKLKIPVLYTYPQIMDFIRSDQPTD